MTRARPRRRVLAVCGGGIGNRLCTLANAVALARWLGPEWPVVAWWPLDEHGAAPLEALIRPPARLEGVTTELPGDGWAWRDLAAGKPGAPLPAPGEWVVRIVGHPAGPVGIGPECPMDRATWWRLWREALADLEWSERVEERVASVPRCARGAFVRLNARVRIERREVPGWIRELRGPVHVASDAPEVIEAARAANPETVALDYPRGRGDLEERGLEATVGATADLAALCRCEVIETAGRRRSSFAHVAQYGRGVPLVWRSL